MTWPDRVVLVEETAPAKVNLWLQVGSRKPDGYHSVRSLAVGVTLEDRIQVWYKPSHGRSVFRVVGAPQLETDDNLCLRAVRWWEERRGRPPGHLEIVLHKEIPIAAGLGGGSSDAAAVLRALARITDVAAMGPDQRDLVELGSDVPFSWSSMPAVVEGRGERLSPRRVGLSWLCLVWPGWSWSTTEAYEALDALRASEAEEAELGLEPDIGWNDFWPLALRRRPELADLHRDLENRGAFAIGMTGKGPTLFGAFESATQAERTAQVLERAGLWARAVQVLPGTSSKGLGTQEGSES